MKDPVLLMRAGIDDLVLDHSSGASALALRGLEHLAEFARAARCADAEALRSGALEFAAGLGRCRPSMMVIENQMEGFRAGCAESATMGLAETRRVLAGLCRDLANRQVAATEATVAHAAALIGEGETLLIHSSSSLVTRTIHACRHRRIRVLVTESLPGGEGVRLAAGLAAEGVDVRLLNDSQMLLGVEQAHRVLVGADAVTREGWVVNKVGTHLLALAAAALSRPFYVLAETLKYTRRGHAEVALESIRAESDQARPEIPREERWFEFTPPQRVGAWVNETGVLHAWPH